MLDECNELRTKILDPSTVPWNIKGKDEKLQTIYKSIGNTTYRIKLWKILVPKKLEIGRKTLNHYAVS